MNTWTVTLNRGSLSETIVDISARLKAQTKATKDEILRTELLVEEMFLRMQKGMDGGDDFSVDITPRRAWGDIELCLKTKGPEYNPMPDVAETGQPNANEEEDLNLVILKWNRKKMSYSYKNATNQVTIKVHELDSGKKQLINTVTGLVLGVVCGLLMQTFLDKETLATINGDAITPLRDMLMNDDGTGDVLCYHCRCHQCLGYGSFRQVGRQDGQCVALYAADDGICGTGTGNHPLLQRPVLYAIGYRNLRQFGRKHAISLTDGFVLRHCAQERG